MRKKFITSNYSSMYHVCGLKVMISSESSQLLFSGVVVTPFEIVSKIYLLMDHSSNSPICLKFFVLCRRVPFVISDVATLKVRYVVPYNKYPIDRGMFCSDIQR